MKHIRGGGVKKLWVFFLPKTRYKLGTDEKRGEQVGLLVFCYSFANYTSQHTLLPVFLPGKVQKTEGAHMPKKRREIWIWIRIPNTAFKECLRIGLLANNKNN